MEKDKIKLNFTAEECKGFTEFVLRIIEKDIKKDKKKEKLKNKKMLKRYYSL